MANVTGSGAKVGAHVRAYYRDYVHADLQVAFTIAASDGTWTLAGLTQSAANTDYYVTYLNANGVNTFLSIIVPSGAGPFVGTAILGTQRPPYIPPTGAGGMSQATADTLYSKLSNATLNVKEYGAKGDGTTNDQAAIQAAVDAASASGASIFFPTGNYLISTPVTIKSHLALLGTGDGSRITATLGAFIWVAHTSNVLIQRLKITAAGGHIFTGTTFGTHQWSIVDCTLVQGGTGFSIWKQDNADSFIAMFFERCDLWYAVGATVPAFDIKGTAGALNNNTFEKCTLNGVGSTAAPFIRIEEYGTTYSFGNRFKELTGENCAGGMVHLFSANGAHFEDIAAWDTASGYSADVIKVAKGSGGSSPNSRNLTFKNYSRNSPGALNGGSVDVRANAGVDPWTIYADNIVTSGTATAATVDFPAGTFVGNSLGLTQLADVQTFVANGTWTKPSWAGPNAITRVILVSGGSGGGSGSRQTVAVAAGGGSGGGSASRSELVVPTSGLTATVAVTVGAAGSGGAAITADTTNGNPGGSGGVTTFGGYLGALAPTGGAGGTLTTSAGGTGGTGLTGATASGGAGGTNGAVGSNGAVGTVSGGGGGAGGINSANTTSLGALGRSGSTGLNATYAGGGTTGAAGTPGAANAANSGIIGGSGGGGASGDAAGTVAGGNGGAGGLYGGAGGGGGGSRNGANSGKGGDGAVGIAIIITTP